MKNKLGLAFVSLIATTFIACGNVNPISRGAGSASSAEIQMPDLSDLNSKLDSVDVQLADVGSQLSALDLQDPLNLLGNNLKNSVKKFSGIIQQVKGKTAELRLNINQQIARLDPSNSQEQKIISKLQEVVSYLDRVDAKLDQVVANLQANVDKLFVKIEKKIENKLSGIKLVLAKLALDKIKGSILENLIGG